MLTLSTREFARRQADERLIVYTEDDLEGDNTLARNADDLMHVYTELTMRPAMLVRVARNDDAATVDMAGTRPLTTLGPRYAVYFRHVNDPNDDETDATERTWRAGNTIRLFTIYSHDYVASARVVDAFDERGSDGVHRRTIGVAHLVLVDWEDPAVVARFFPQRT